MSRRIALSVVLFLFAHAGFTQTPADSESMVRQRVEALTQVLHQRPGDPTDEARFVAQRDAATTRVRAEIDGFVASALDPFSLRIDRVRKSLQSILASHWVDSEYAGPHYAQFVETVRGPALVLAFSIVRAAHNDAPSIRGYSGGAGRFVLTASAGDDLVGHTIATSELPAPILGEAWFLVTGRAQSFNGTKIRYRAYAFDGERIRVLWDPEDMLNAQLTMTTFGFTVKHMLKNQVPWRFVEDDYQLVLDGVSTIGRRFAD